MLWALIQSILIKIRPCISKLKTNIKKVTVSLENYSTHIIIIYCAQIDSQGICTFRSVIIMLTCVYKKVCPTSHPEGVKCQYHAHVGSMMVTTQHDLVCAMTISKLINNPNWPHWKACIYIFDFRTRLKNQFGQTNPQLKTTSLVSYIDLWQLKINLCYSLQFVDRGAISWRSYIRIVQGLAPL